MVPRFGLIVASSLREISLELDRAGATPAASPAPPSAPSTAPPSAPSTAPPLVDVSSAERLASGAMIFPMRTGSSFTAKTAWHVFARPAGAGSGVAQFDGAGVIDAATDDDAFVELAYRVILRRDADRDGYRAYLDSLRRGLQTRRGMLRDLAGSPEARDRGRLLLIMPGDWLSPANEADQPPPAVRVDLGRLPA